MEIDYDPGTVYYIFKHLDHSVPIIAVILYFLFIYFGQRIMKDRKPFDLKGVLAFWNLSLSLFSFYGAIRIVPHLLHRIMTLSFEDTVCEAAQISYGCGVAGLVSQLFVLSKIPELFDTVFIVLRKKPLIFLHWYHHITVLLYCWNSYITESAAGIYFVAMNYTVHAIMYFYFFLQAVNLLPKWFPSYLITLVQISQMFIGCFIVGACLYYDIYGGVKYAPKECHNASSTLIAGLLMYGSYTYLFLEFAIKRFIFGSATNSGSSASGGKNKKVKKVE